MKKIPVGILGATGMVGQQYVHHLMNHPWFEITFLAASDQSAGKTYSEAVLGRCHTLLQLPDQILNCQVHRLEDIELAKKSCRFVFSAMTNEGAKLHEEIYAKNGFPVISNAGYHRLSRMFLC